MRGVEAPDDAAKSYVAKGNAPTWTARAVPSRWTRRAFPRVRQGCHPSLRNKQGGALQKRWAEFLTLSVPFLTRVATLSITGGASELSKNDLILGA